MKKSRFSPLIIFYILVAYIFIQFCWWAYHIVSLNKEIHQLKIENLYLVKSMQAEQQKLIDESLDKKIWMVVGEGSVFFFFLVLGAVITRNSFKKEVALGNQQKNFLLSVTHELKSPISSVKLYLETLLRHDIEKEKQKEIAANSLHETERLLSLVENILFAAKIESGTCSFHKEQTNLSELTEEIISKTIFFRQKTHLFVLNIQPGIFFETDVSAFTSIVLNLLENAVKYSPAQTEIVIHLKKQNNSVSLSIADKGIGVAENEKENIFKKFYRTGNEETRKTKGTGLGLFIVKYLVGQLDGNISVKNNSLKGSIFEAILT